MGFILVWDCGAKHMGIYGESTLLRSHVVHFRPNGQLCPIGTVRIYGDLWGMYGEPMGNLWESMGRLDCGA